MTIEEFITTIQNEGISTNITLLIWFCIYLYIAWAISVHRITILGPNSVAKFGDVLPNKRIGRYLLVIFLLLIISFVFALINGIISSFLPQTMLITGIITNLIMFYFLIKVSLKFPAIAIDNKDNIKVNLATGQISSLFLILVLFPFLFSVGLVYIIQLLGDNIFISTLSFLIQFFVSYWSIVSLSLCHQELQSQDIS
ncbi:hypothetical protein MNB_SUP05-5-413 [hydrothermal vent metagenome]|uniref:Uncharacterized protein n=1 Tax=hydrothermal vent metagenome TaxID=652676 RepID=A0A1W1CCG4_9ZZZZ